MLLRSQGKGRAPSVPHCHAHAPLEPTLATSTRGTQEFGIARAGQQQPYSTCSSSSHFQEQRAAGMKAFRMLNTLTVSGANRTADPDAPIGIILLTELPPSFALLLRWCWPAPSSLSLFRHCRLDLEASSQGIK